MIEELTELELDSSLLEATGAKSVGWYLEVIQAAEWLGEKAYALGYWMGSH